MSTRVHHSIFARYYARASPAMERAGIADHRAELLAGLTGRVIDVGAGAGANFRHYPPGATRAVTRPRRSRPPGSPSATSTG